MGLAGLTGVFSCSIPGASTDTLWPLGGDIWYGVVRQHHGVYRVMGPHHPTVGHTTGQGDRAIGKGSNSKIWYCDLTLNIFYKHYGKNIGYQATIFMAVSINYMAADLIVT